MHRRVSSAILRFTCVFSLAVSHVKSSEPDYLFPDIQQDLYIKQHSDFYTGHPEKVDVDGKFLSFTVSHHFSERRRKRELSSAEQRVFYKLNYKGRALTLNLTRNNYLLSGEYVLERRSGSLMEKLQQASGNTACHLIGTVVEGNVVGTAAISTCDGLRGLLNLPEGPLLIEPVRGLYPNSSHPRHPHVIYQSSTWSSAVRPRRSTDQHSTPRSRCGVKDDSQYSQKVERGRELWEQALDGEAPRRIYPRSISRERWVETMVVGDAKMVDYHGSGSVAGIFHHASIGNAIHIVLVRLILLHGEEKGLKIIHHADTTLNSFCTWQKNLNPQSDAHPAHHDVALLITRKDICAGKNQPCETLGLSHLSGMCQPHRSCNINEDSGLPVAFTIAHELGHSFGIQHDGQSNDCEPVGKQPFIMSRQLQYDSSPLTWSSCSKEYITRFLDRGWGSCLDDRPSKRDMSFPGAAPGARYTRYTPHHQCQLHGASPVSVWGWGSFQKRFTVAGDPGVTGPTAPGPVELESSQQTENATSPSTFTPPCFAWPEFGGKYCTGERKRYTVCNTKPCVTNHPSFREMQCSEFNTVPYHNELYRWIPVASTLRPCELHCKPVDEDFSEKMLDAVTDGTPCFSNNSRNICVNGVCKEVGCDFGINSNAKEDRCGVCLGDGSTCETVKDNFVEQDGFGYMDLVLIPEGARDIYIQEVEEAGNFLAIRAEDSDEYFLNGNFIIQWNGEYEAGGTTFFYERSGNMENLTSAGPTTEPVMIQLLFQELNPGVRYEYSIKRQRPMGNEILEPEYFWKRGAWTDCSTTCGLGEQHQPVRCFEPEFGVVEETLCDPNKRPDDRRRKCKNRDCPARWWVGGWQSCSSSCGSSGVRKRTVLCVRTVSGEERVLQPGDCKQLLKPKPLVPCNRDVPCGREWTVGNWSESRIINCGAKPPNHCDAGSRPRSTILCNLQSCTSANRSTGSPTRPQIPPKIPAQTERPEFGFTKTPPNTASTKHTKTSDIIHEDDREFILVKDGQTINDYTTVPTIIGAPKDEEGSADLRPLNKNETTGYDYIEDAFGEERGRGDNFISGAPGFNIETITVVADVSTAIYSPFNDDFITSPNTSSSTNEPSSTPNPRLANPRAPNSAVKVQREASQMHKVAKKGHQRQEVMTFTEDYGNLKGKERVTKKAAFWEVGNWSECSTSCGLGAVWRSVSCSSEREEDCSSVNKPEPARRCHMRPCAVWKSGNWSKCPSGCTSDRKFREVQCVDPQSERFLRPFHCQTLSFKPASSRPCTTLPCLPWKHSSWGECSKSCGEGFKERLVLCPEEQRCNISLKPSATEPCRLQPCTSWASEAWSECSKSCGGGVQKRAVRCINQESGKEEQISLCVESNKPNVEQSCNPEDCKEDSGVVCKKSRMSRGFCEKLKLLGRCSLLSIRRQCCATCVM
ncbi:hypothetical protein DNTS_011669 [Danionella cerebrum]|uniref:Peptidase M12B domain-containing protein n=1 Tax=Danionella cerebrum TaxID=2873325 RepID=A0A553P1D7_9TELE|nr:hypothetical protein DNTS_011669 [Danionella translucida]